MSDHSVAQLTLAIERLTLATNNLSAQLRTVGLSRETTAEPSGSISDPVPSLPRRPQTTVEELFRVPFPDSFEQHLQASRFGGLEGGPGPLPGSVGKRQQIGFLESHLEQTSEPRLPLPRDSGQT